MQEIRWHLLLFVIFEIIATLLILSIFDIRTSLVFLIFTLMLFLGFHIYWIYRLNQWLDNPMTANLPDGYGLWEKLFTKLYKTQAKQKKSKRELYGALDQFKSAAEAMLDGVISVDQNNEIVWCNKTAQSMLNILPKSDYGRPITYIFRNSIFKNYIENSDYEDTLKIINHLSMQPLEIKVAYFRSNQKLIICRDITKDTENQNMRKEFVSNFSHELKTPLTVIIGFIETLGGMYSKDTSENKIITMMDKQAYRMKGLIDDLLLLSNVESNQHLNRSNKIVMSDLFKLIKKDIALLDGNNHTLDYSINTKLNLYGEKREIESAFKNIITNAIRYTGKGGQINIRWNLINELGVFEVTDSGIGIPKKDIDRICERFYRVNADRSRETGGTGLGLAIVKNVMIQHQGELKISSELGSGSTFKLIFPTERLIQSK
ncbi:MAG: phosphate regulon sensor histidine kinase PhoR [Rhodospirillaceae bacterium]|nr:phosphate regulon sensor histidine kinase PhoR [Rhodospirillaceae bacterium]